MKKSLLTLVYLGESHNISRELTSPGESIKIEIEIQQCRSIISGDDTKICDLHCKGTPYPHQRSDFMHFWISINTEYSEMEYRVLCVVLAMTTPTCSTDNNNYQLDEMIRKESSDYFLRPSMNSFTYYRGYRVYRVEVRTRIQASRWPLPLSDPPIIIQMRSLSARRGNPCHHHDPFEMARLDIT